MQKEQTNQKQNSRRTILLAMSLLWTASMSFAAGPTGGAASGAAGAAGSGGEHATGGQGGHTEAPAATPASATSSRVVASPSAANPNSSSTPLNNQRTSTADHANIRGDRGHNNRSNDQQFEYTYGYPWWGYGDGWGWGGYNTGFMSDDNSNGNNSNTNDAGGSQNSPAMTPPSEPAPTAPTAAQQAAMAQNAIGKSPALVRANDAVQAAQAAYDTEQQRVIASLQDKTEYRQAISKQKSADSQLQQTRSIPTTMPVAGTSATLGAATAKMDASSDVTKMQQQAITADSAASAAKTRLDQAVANRDALEAKLNRK